MADAYFADNSPAMVALEEMIDKAGVRNVLYAVAHICFAKAEHIRANWQDKTTAGVWNLQGNMIDSFAGKLHKKVSG